MTKTVTFLMAGVVAGGLYEPVAFRALFTGLSNLTHTILVATALDTLQPGSWYIIGGVVVMGLAFRASAR